jgi:hypothetical protein
MAGNVKSLGGSPLILPGGEVLGEKPNREEAILALNPQLQFLGQVTEMVDVMVQQNPRLQRTQAAALFVPKGSEAPSITGASLVAVTHLDLGNLELDFAIPKTLGTTYVVVPESRPSKAVLSPKGNWLARPPERTIEFL